MLENWRENSISFRLNLSVIPEDTPGSPAAPQVLPAQGPVRFCAVSPSHRKPTSPQMKSLQLWQKVGLVRVTFFMQWPGAELWYLCREPGDCCGLFFNVRGLPVLQSATSESAGVVRPQSAMSSSPTSHKLRVRGGSLMREKSLHL